MAPNSNPLVYNVQVLDRSVALLEALRCSDRPLSLLELSERLGIHKSTVHRLLNVLKRHRLVERTGDLRTYQLGLRLFEMGCRAVERLDLREKALPHLERLAIESGETAHLCILREGEVLYLEKVEPVRTVRMPSRIGQRNPAHCTSVGKVLLAHLPEDELNEIVRTYGLRRFTKNTITTLSALKQELTRIRVQGFSLDREEIEEGLKCIGAPVRDYSGIVVASISIAGPAFRVTKATLPALAKHVIASADVLSADLGYRALPERIRSRDR